MPNGKPRLIPGGLEHNDDLSNFDLKPFYDQIRSITTKEEQASALQKAVTLIKRVQGRFAPEYHLHLEKGIKNAVSIEAAYEFVEEGMFETSHGKLVKTATNLDKIKSAISVYKDLEFRDVSVVVNNALHSLPFQFLTESLSNKDRVELRKELTQSFEAFNAEVDLLKNEGVWDESDIDRLKELYLGAMVDGLMRKTAVLLLENNDFALSNHGGKDLSKEKKHVSNARFIRVLKGTVGNALLVFSGVTSYMGFENMVSKQVIHFFEMNPALKDQFLLSDPDTQMNFIRAIACVLAMAATGGLAHFKKQVTILASDNNLGFFRASVKFFKDSVPTKKEMKQSYWAALSAAGFVSLFATGGIADMASNADQIIDYILGGMDRAEQIAKLNKNIEEMNLEIQASCDGFADKMKKKSNNFTSSLPDKEERGDFSGSKNRGLMWDTVHVFGNHRGGLKKMSDRPHGSPLNETRSYMVKTIENLDMVSEDLYPNMDEGIYTLINDSCLDVAGRITKIQGLQGAFDKDLEAVYNVDTLAQIKAEYAAINQILGDIEKLKESEVGVSMSEEELEIFEAKYKSETDWINTDMRTSEWWPKSVTQGQAWESGKEDARQRRLKRLDAKKALEKLHKQYPNNLKVKVDLLLIQYQQILDLMYHGARSNPDIYRNVKNTETPVIEVNPVAIDTSKLKAEFQVKTAKDIILEYLDEGKTFNAISAVVLALLIGGFFSHGDGVFFGTLNRAAIRDRDETRQRLEDLDLRIKGMVKNIMQLIGDSSSPFSKYFKNVEIDEVALEKMIYSYIDDVYVEKKGVDRWWNTLLSYVTISPSSDYSKDFNMLFESVQENLTDKEALLNKLFPLLDDYAGTLESESMKNLNDQMIVGMAKENFIEQINAISFETPTHTIWGLERGKDSILEIISELMSLSVLINEKDEFASIAMDLNSKIAYETESSMYQFLHFAEECLNEVALDEEEGQENFDQMLNQLKDLIQVLNSLKSVHSKSDLYFFIDKFINSVEQIILAQEESIAQMVKDQEAQAIKDQEAQFAQDLLNAELQMGETIKSLISIYQANARPSFQRLNAFLVAMDLDPITYYGLYDRSAFDQKIKALKEFIVIMDYRYQPSHYSTEGFDDLIHVLNQIQKDFDTTFAYVSTKRELPQDYFVGNKVLSVDSGFDFEFDFNKSEGIASVLVEEESSEDDLEFDEEESDSDEETINLIDPSTWDGGKL